MKPFSKFALVTLAGLLASNTAPALADEKVSEVSMEGLELVEKDRRGEIYANPEVDWGDYTQIRLDPATVAFRKNWQRDQNRQQPFKVKDEDMERIRSDIAEIFDEVFRVELRTDGGYEMTAENGENVLRIKPHIVDLDIYAPDTVTPGISRSYTRSAGRMTLKLEIYDSVTGDLLAKASDRREAPDYGYLQWTTKIRNNMEMRRLMERWAEGLRTRLDEARNQAEAQ